MSSPSLVGSLARKFAASTLVACVFAAQQAVAQQPPPAAPAEAQPAAAEPATPPLAETPAGVADAAPMAAADSAPTPGVAADDLATLKTEVAALKAKAEEAELAALSEAPADTQSEPDPIRIYGFMDFGFDKFFFRDPEDDGFALLRPTSASTFVFGNLNMYFDARPVDKLRSLVEVRLTLAPHGEETSLGPPLGATSYDRVDTVAFDYSSPSSQSQLRLGSIFIERAWTEYQFNELFKLQWGLFLNPFGIWNLDHGSPTLISLMLPTFIASQMVPTRLLGVNLYGSTFFGSAELGYALHVSNGRTPLDFDLSEDKAIGLRVYFAEEGDSRRVVLGVNGYIGSYLDQEKKINPSAAGNVFDWKDVVDYAEQVVGLDAAVDLGALRMRSEAVFRWVTYNEGKSERIFTADGSEQYLPNRLEWDVYALFAYRTPWKVEPYLQFELSHKSYVLPRYAGKARATASGATPLVASIGFNIELTTHTLFKTQLAYVRAYDEDLEDVSLSMPYLFVRLVNSF